MNQQELTPHQLLQQSHILLCEADPALQEAWQLMLGEAGRLVVLPTLEATVSALERELPHLLLVDCDGQPNPLSVLQSLTAQYPTLKICLIAGEFTLAFQEAAVRLGIISFLTKPWKSQQVVERIDTMLRGYALHPIRQRVLHFKNTTLSQ